MKWFILFPCIALAAPLTVKNEPYNVNRNWNARAPSEYYGEWPGNTYNPSPDHWEAQIIYHIVIDRFRDGDPKNNELAFYGYNPRSTNMRHGGDFKGITEKLDYLKELGITALWLSPIFQTPENEYHGYGQIDFTLIDQRFGTLEELRTLVKEAHRRGIYVLIDVIVNHLSYYYAFKGYENVFAPFKLHKGEYEKIKRFPDRQYDDFTFDNTWDPDGTHCSVFDSQGNLHESTGRGTFTKSDFYHNGNLDDFNHPFSNAFGSIYGKYNDLRLCAPHVAKKVIAMTKSLIASTDIDGIRLDTPMQVPNSFIKEWSSEIKSYAKTLGKKDFFIMGETFALRPQVSPMIRRGKDQNRKFISETLGLDGGINYPLYIEHIIPMFWGNFDKVFDIDKFREIEKETYDLFDPVTKSERYLMANFSESHDQRRLSSIDPNIGLLSYVYISFLPGIPIIYQGQEQLLDSFGSGLEGDAREPLMENPWWRDRPSRSIPNRAAKDNFDMTSDSFRAFSFLNYLRREAIDTKKLFAEAEKIDNRSWRVPLKDGSKGVFSFGESGSNILCNQSQCVTKLASFLASIDFKKPFITAYPSHDTVISPAQKILFSGKDLGVIANNLPFKDFIFENGFVKPKTRWPLGIIKLRSGSYEVRYQVAEPKKINSPRFSKIGEKIRITPSLSGAELFRVKMKDSWSDWSETSSSIEIDSLNWSSLQEIEVQYFRDGSSSLFESQYVDLYGGHSVEQGIGFTEGVK
jgi:glycosidase